MLTLTDILDAKERRVRRRMDLHQSYPAATIVSITLNIPGPAKDSPVLRDLFREAVTAFTHVFPSYEECRTCYEETGPHGLIALQARAASVKEATCRLESCAAYARLWDMDVFDEQDRQIASPSRKSGRTCLLCSRPAVLCMREHTHTAAEIAEKVSALLAAFLIEKSATLSEEAKQMGQLACRAALCEAACTPSPGLVDVVHQGSHKDMDFYTYINSSTALAPWFARFYELGRQYPDQPSGLLPLLRIVGQRAEAAMYGATHHVNTHKGLIFSLGLVLAALGKLAQEGIPPATETVPSMIREIAAGLTNELAHTGTPATAGETVYRQYHITGIRGEAEQGFPHIFQQSLPALTRDLAAHEPLNKALVHTLFVLISCTDDTTILHRQPDLQVLQDVREDARNILEKEIFNQDNWQEALWEIDKKWVALNISPGGSADLLTLTYFLWEVREKERE